MPKPILCIDFDGVIHSYERGWQNGELYGKATDGFFAWATQAKEHFILTIYSSRSKNPALLQCMADWMAMQLDLWLMQVTVSKSDLLLRDFSFAHEKPPAFLTIDDRGLTFTGNWNDFPPEKLLTFKPWNVV